MREIGSGLWQATVRLGDSPVEPFADFFEAGSAGVPPVGVSMFEVTDPDSGAIGWAVTALYRAPPDGAATCEPWT